MAALQSFCEAYAVPMASAQAVELALDELLTNSITHGQLDPVQGLITVELELRDQELHIVVSDNGIAFDPFSQPEPDLTSSLEQRQLGGVGIHLVKNCMDSYAYQRIEGRNVISLRRRLQPAE